MLESRPNREDEIALVRQGLVTRVEGRHKAGTIQEGLSPEEISWQKYIKRTTQGRRMEGPPGLEAWAAQGGYMVIVYRETKCGEGYTKLVECGDVRPLDAGILSTKKWVYAVLRGFRDPTNDTDKVAAAVQRLLASAQEVQERPDETPDGVRRPVIPGDGKCLYWALSLVEGQGGQAAADEVCRALTKGDMAKSPDATRARRVMRDAHVRTWGQ